MESEEISKVIDQLKSKGECSIALLGIHLFWMDGWIQMSSHRCGMNFSSTETLTRWLSKQDTPSNSHEEMAKPDEGAFSATLDAWPKDGIRPDQKKFEIYYDEVQQVSSWDNYHFAVTRHGVTKTWNDFFELDAPAKTEVENYSFDEYYLNGTNDEVKQYLEAEGLVSANPKRVRFNTSNNAELLEADRLLREILEKVCYKLTGKKLKKEYWPEVRESYRTGDRFYHNLIHIANVYKALMPFKNKVADWEMLIVAVIYHDIIYDVQRHDNEEQSAACAKEVLSNLKVNSNRISRCVNHILATKNHAASTDPDTNLLIDADLSVLGSAPEVYKTYADAIRQEYNFYPDSEFYAGRKAALEKFLEREVIYTTPEFQGLEERARGNIRNEIEGIVSRG